MAKLLLLLFVFCILQSKAQTSGDNNKLNSDTKLSRAFSFEASYVGDLCRNNSGGLKKGMVYLGMANSRMGFDTRLAGFWKGGYLFLNAATTYGNSPSASLVGDFQVISNIDAGEHIYMQECWFRQSFGKMEFTVGLQDLNTRFLSCNNSGVYMNSSFGVPSVVSNNSPVPIFPLTSLGITGKYDFSKNISLLGAIYDGFPTPFESNPYNTDWRINKQDGSFGIVEIQFTSQLAGKPGTIKTGCYYHSRLQAKNPESGSIEQVFKSNRGFYIMADQQVWSSSGSEKSLDIFVQAVVSPSNINCHHYYIGAGINMTAPFRKSGDDMAGIAIAHAGFKDCIHPSETALELLYKSKITPNISLQPDLQYIIDPSGTEKQVPDAFVSTLRLSIKF